MAEARLAVEVAARRAATAQVSVLTLQPVDGSVLPAYAPGAHIDLHLRPGLSRSYSLLRPFEPGRGYEVAVQCEPAGRGGSLHVHERLHAGMRLQVSAPRNHFALREDAPHTVLIAGGIGITPLLCMALRLQALGRPWQLHYATRSRERAAFLPELQSHGERVALHFDEDGRVLDLQALVDAVPPEAELYACGPAPMLDAFLRAAAGRPPQQVHIERFAAAPASEASPSPSPSAQGFELVLARSGMRLQVQPGERILDKLLEAGCDVSYSCQDGVCGSCETRVLEGVPEHRDSVLGEAERRAGTTMMVCCSGARSERLVLDL